MFLWLIATATVVFLGARLAATDPVLAVCCVLLIVGVNLFGVFACRTLLRSMNNEGLLEDVEPLTNLLTRDGFAEKVATLMSLRGRGGDRYLAVVVVNLDSFSLLQDNGRRNGGQPCASGLWARVCVRRSVASRCSRTSRRRSSTSPTYSPAMIRLLLWNGCAPRLRLRPVG